MKIAVMSRNGKLYSTRRLVEAAKARGHEIRVIDTLRCYMNVATHHPSIHYRGDDLVGYDAVIPRIKPSITFYGCALVRQFERRDKNGFFRANSFDNWRKPRYWSRDR